LARRLLTSGHLKRDAEHSTLSLGRPAFELFRDKGPYLVPQELVGGGVGPGSGGYKRTARTERAGTAGTARRTGKIPLRSGVPLLVGDDIGTGAAELFASLRRLRKELADQAGVPPYVVFPDRTLIEMAKARPASEAALAGLYGIGRAKLERYGAAFLTCIRNHTDQG